MHHVLFLPICLILSIVSLSMSVYLFFWLLWFSFGLWLQSTVECWRRPKETLSEGEVCSPAGLFVSSVSSHHLLPSTLRSLWVGWQCLCGCIYLQRLLISGSPPPVGWLIQLKGFALHECVTWPIWSPNGCIIRTGLRTGNMAARWFIPVATPG